MANNPTVNRQVNIFIASGEAEKAYDRLIKKEVTLKEELKKATDPKEIARLNAELKKLEEPIDRAARKVKGTLQPTIREISQTISTLNRQLENVAVGSAQFEKLSVKVRQARIELAEAKLRAEGLNSSLSQKAFGGFTSFLQGIGLGFGVGIFQEATGLIKDFFSGPLEEAQEARRQVNNLKQSLEASGQTDVFDRLIAKADEFAKTFKFLDNDDITGVFTQLIDYGRLTENQMNKLIPVIVDFYGKQRLAGNTNFTLAESAKVVIKGLEGQGKALKEYGINIKDGGDLTERFNIIMNDLGGKVKGAGDAFANDLTGQVAASRQELKNLQEDIGNDLIPIWEKLKIGALDAIKGIISGVKEMGRMISEATLSRNELEKKRANEADLRREELRKENALRFANDASKKTLAEQDKILAEEKFIAQQSAKRFEDERLLAIAMGEEFSKRQQWLAQEMLQDEARVKALEESIRIQKSKTVLGVASTTGTGSKENDDLKRLLAEIQAKARELDLVNADAFDKAISKINEFYNRWVERAKGNAAIIKQIEDLRIRETTLLIDQYVKQVDDAEQRRLKRRSDRQKAEEDRLTQERLQKLLDFQTAVARLAEETANKALGQRRFKNEVDLLVGDGKARLAAKLDQLKIEEEAEILSAEKTGKAIEDIRRKYAKLRQDEELARIPEIIKNISFWINQVGSIVSTFFDLQTQKEQAQLEQDRVNNERKKENFKRQLDGKILSQKEYDKKVADLDKQQEAKERQARIREFNRNKATQLLNATINVAAQVAANLTPPWMAALVAALGAIQIGIIASAQPPKLEKGGRLSGPLHTAGGMPIIDPRSGRKVAEVEGGEVFLSRATVRNNASLVDQLLHSSMHRGGAPISPAWRNISPSYMNLPYISQSINSVRLFDKGGVAVIPGAMQGGSAIETETLRTLNESVAFLNSILANGIRAYSVITEQEAQQQRLDDIRKDANMT